MAIKKYSAVCCYYGQWPSYFKLWLKSASYNENIDFFLFTDIPVALYEIPQNVKIVRLTFLELKELVKKKFPNIDISLDKPYKLCDFKTAYGYLFQEYLKDYHFWGYYDIDTIWGNIESFLPKGNDKKWVKFLPCGHLSFIKNEGIYITPYKLSETCNNVVGWEKVYSSKENYYYDEVGGYDPLFKTVANESYFRDIVFQDVEAPYRHLHFTSIHEPKRHFMVFTYDKGHLYRYCIKRFQVCRDEIAYVHLQKRMLKICTTNSDAFSLVPNRFVDQKIINNNITGVLTLLWLGRPRYLKITIIKVYSKAVKLLKKFFKVW